MANILKRFIDIMAANINALLDKAEDPEVMIDQYLRELNENLGNVKAETAAIMAEEARAKRERDDCEAEIGKLQVYAEKAVLAGNDNDARTFLEQKNLKVAALKGLEEAYVLAAENAQRLQGMHDKLVKDIEELNARRDAIRAKVKVAKTQEKINEMTSSLDDSQASLEAFERMEEKADRMLDKANAMAELNAAENVDVEELASKYDAPTAPEVEDELAALKAKLGK